MSREECGKHTLWLAKHRYFAVPMSELLICRAVRECDPPKLVETLTVASSATPDFDEAAKAGVRALKWMATNPVGVSLEFATRAIVVAATSRKWGGKSAGRALAREAMEESVFLPRRLAAILKELSRR